MPLIIDPYQIAIQGLSSDSLPITIATQGWIVEVFITGTTTTTTTTTLPTTTIPETTLPEPSFGGGGSGSYSIPLGFGKDNISGSTLEERFIIVKATKNGVTITKKKKVKDVNLTVKDFDISIVENNGKPKISIKISKKEDL